MGLHGINDGLARDDSFTNLHISYSAWIKCRYCYKQSKV